MLRKWRGHEHQSHKALLCALLVLCARSFVRSCSNYLINSQSTQATRDAHSDLLTVNFGMVMT